VKNGLRDLGHKTPGFTGAPEQAGQLIALKSQHSGQTNARKIGRLGSINKSVLGHQILFCRANVGGGVRAMKTASRLALPAVPADCLAIGPEESAPGYCRATD